LLWAFGLENDLPDILKKKEVKKEEEEART